MPRDIDDLPLSFTVERLESNEDDRLGFFPAQSIGYAVQGFSRSLVLISHFAATGRVKKRPPYDESVVPLVGPPKLGSLDILFLLEIARSTVNEFGVEVTKDFVGDLISYSINSIIGKKPESHSKNIDKIIADRGGNVQTLLDSIEAPIRVSHSPITDSNININIYSGEKKIIGFDEDTRHFIEYEEYVDDIEIGAATVSALNVTSRSGRVMLVDEERSVPFRVLREASRKTIRELGKSLNEFAANYAGDIALTYYKILDQDGNTKRIEIIDAETF